jgi:dTDP-4-dehydrorhamnose reductase
MKSTAIIGANGQLGSDFVKVFTADKGYRVYGLTHRDIEVADYSSCEKLININPDIVVNTAAYHRVDECEENPEKAFAVNSLGAFNIARICSEIGAVCVYISTDFVFDGKKDSPYDEDDTPNPINVYGISKLAGEYLTKTCEKHYIIRTASLYGVAGSSGKGGNFIETVIGKALRGEKLKIVDDIYMSPTHTLEVAVATKEILERELPYGAYHVVCDGYCSWWEFAKEIVSILALPVGIEPIKSSEYNFKARRPRFSALKSIYLPRYKIILPNWRTSLKEYMKLKGYLKE